MYTPSKPPKFGRAMDENITISFDTTLTPDDVMIVLNALADYYRACGGVGIRIDPELEESLVAAPEPEYV